MRGNVVAAGRHAVAKYAANMRQVAVRQAGFRQRLAFYGQGVVGLLILAPADAADEALVVEQNSLPAQANA